MFNKLQGGYFGKEKRIKHDWWQSLVSGRAENVFWEHFDVTVLSKMDPEAL